MAQLYTKNRPTRSGYYWATDTLERAPVIYRVDTHDDTAELTVDTNEGYLPVNHAIFDGMFWSHCPIPEPIGIKI